MREEKPWTIEAVQHLIRLAHDGCEVQQICVLLGRPEPMVRDKLGQLGLSRSAPAEAPTEAPATLSARSDNAEDRLAWR
jgi:hypothetical protein